VAVYVTGCGNIELVRTHSTIAVFKKPGLSLASNEAGIRAGNICSCSCADQRLRGFAPDRAKKSSTCLPSEGNRVKYE
jgi:hypothetical protein